MTWGIHSRSVNSDFGRRWSGDGVDSESSESFRSFGYLDWNRLGFDDGLNPPSAAYIISYAMLGQFGFVFGRVGGWNRLGFGIADKVSIIDTWV